MNTFLRPTIFKVVMTLILLLVIFFGEVFYYRTLTFTENGLPQQLNPLLIVANVAWNFMSYPAHIIVGFFVPINIYTYQNNPSLIIIALIISLILAILEIYLIACIISLFVNRIHIGQDK